MPDPKFADARLARLYDPLEGGRVDLDAYLAIADELGARRVLDVGCGTGTFALLLADRGVEVVGVDPAEASIAVARAKPRADRVSWVVGEAPAALPLQVDLVTMTGNVAQVFPSEAAWREVLRVAHEALRPGGRLVFETRDPARRAWQQWTRGPTDRVTEIEGVGPVRDWDQVLDVLEAPDGLLVTFESMVVLPDGTELPSSSTLRFPGRDRIESSLRETGFALAEVRDAPDRPGREWVFVARRPEG